MDYFQSFLTGPSPINPTDYSSPPDSAYPSAVSTPPPIFEDQETFPQSLLDTRHQGSRTFHHSRSILPNSLASTYEYTTYNGPLPTAATAVGQLSSYTPAGLFDTQPQYADHWQPFELEDTLHSVGSPVDPRDNSSGSRGKRDNEGEEGFTVGDRKLMLQAESHRFRSKEPGEEDARLSLKLQRRYSPPRQFNAQYERGRGPLLGKQVTTGGPTSEIMLFSPDWDGSSSSSGALGRANGYASSALIPDSPYNLNDLQEKTPQTVSNIKLLEQCNDGLDHPAQWRPTALSDVSDSVSRLSSIGPSPGDNPSNNYSSTNLAEAVNPDIDIPITCTNCSTQATPLWRRDLGGSPLCNACGLFFKLHGINRPLSLKTDVIKKRKRSSIAISPSGGRGMCTQAIKQTRASRNYGPDVSSS